jgi:heme-degrading monooxygenase HmoA
MGIKKGNSLDQIIEIEIIWEYTVKENYMDRFLEIYSPNGAWSKLFEKYPGYIRTELKRDTSDSYRFITIDYWVSFSAYSEMREKSKLYYDSLDEQCSLFTDTENCIGIFKVV